MRPYSEPVLKFNRLTMLAVLAGLIGLQGCVSPVALDRAVMAYDQVTTELLSKQ